MKTVYFDHSATTPVHPEVFAAMEPFLKDIYGNASSIHFKGKEARRAVEESRSIISSFLGTESADIIFTSGGTEANNLAVKGISYYQKEKFGKDHIITDKIEHPSVLNTFKFLEETGFKVTYLSVDRYGIVDPQEVSKAIGNKTSLVSIMHCNNEIGTLQDIGQIGAICRERGVYFHTDVVQSFTKEQINPNQMDIDLLSISGHKFYAPKGIGVLFLRKGVEILPLLQGGHHERNLRPGTENVAAIVGIAKAVEIAQRNMGPDRRHIQNLAHRFSQGLKERIDDIYFNGHPEKRLPGILNIGFKFIEGESLLMHFDLKGICASTGSACTSGTLQPSHVLTAIGLDPVIAQGTVRFSLGRENTQEEIDYALEVIPPIVKRLRSMSPLAGQ